MKEMIIDRQQQQLVLEATRYYTSQAAAYFKRSFPEIPVLFDLRGRSAGMYRVRGEARCIRYNPWIFGRYFDQNLGQTVPHEVAHYVTDLQFGRRAIRPHGGEWRSVMSIFGADTRVRFSCNLEGLPQRLYQRLQYRCQCRTHQLTKIRHNRILRGRRYYCRTCGSELLPA